MRRFLALMLCCLLFATTVYADNAASSVQSNATVSSDGSCQVSLTMSIRLDEPVSSLSLPLGSGVSSVRLNGSGARTFTSNGITNVRLNNLVRNVTGTVPITVTFTVNSVVTTEEGQDAEGQPITKQIVTVPLLYGFNYPVEQMSFTVTMPGEFDTVPTFLSGYHQQDIESSITSSVSGAAITGSVDFRLFCTGAEGPRNPGHDPGSAGRHVPPEPGRRRQPPVRCHRHGRVRCTGPDLLADDHVVPAPVPHPPFHRAGGCHRRKSWQLSGPQRRGP